VILIVHNNRDHSSAFQQLHQPIQLAGSYDGRRDQYVVDVLSHQCLRFMERCCANTNSPCGYLPPRNLCTFMALGVRACLQSVEVYLVLTGFMFRSKASKSRTKAGVVSSRRPPGFPISLA
jgi:hypothetical protein